MLADFVNCIKNNVCLVFNFARYVLFIVFMCIGFCDYMCDVFNNVDINYHQKNMYTI